MTELDVILYGRRIGSMSGQGQSYYFQYDSDYVSDREAVAISVSMPLREGEIYNIFPWVSGLMPDNTEVLKEWYGIVGDAVSAAPIDLLATRIGLDCAGAIQFCKPTDRDRVLSDRESGIRPLSQNQMIKWCRKLRSSQKSWFGMQEVRDISQFSLAGAQAKMALHRMSDGRWGQSYGDIPTTHILKPDADPNFPQLPLAEHVTQDTAARLGMSVAKTELQQFGEYLCLVVERYDRQFSPDGVVSRIHQEDLCQALGFHPSQKYQKNGGPSPVDIVNVLERERDKLAFFEALVYSSLVVSTDGHAKNYSLLLPKDEPSSLTPLYDICTFLPFQDVKWRKISLAMRAGAKRYYLRHADKTESWQSTIRMLEIDRDYASDRIGNMAASLFTAWEASLNDLPSFINNIPHHILRVNDIIRYRGTAYEQIAEGLAVRRRPTVAPKQADEASSGVLEELEIHADTPSSSENERCGWIGERSNKPCIRRKGHHGAHQYK